MTKSLSSDYIKLKYFKLNDDATLTIDGNTMRYIIDTTEDCFRLNENDVLVKLAKHQLGMYYILGAPIQAQLMDSFSPK